jgi:DNA replication licensing factor MCM2
MLEDNIPSRKIEYIPQELLKKYIMYARKYIKPKLSEVNKNKVANFYAELRKESDKLGGISIAVRHLESLIRIAEAHAKMHLREDVRTDDIDIAIKVMLESFLQSQKFSISKNLRKKFSQYLTLQEDTKQLLFNILERMEKENVKNFS